MSVSEPIVMKFQPLKLYNQFRQWLKVDLKLSRKGLILVFVPMGFVLLIMGMLAYLLNEAETEVWKESDSKTIITRANSISRDFIKAEHISPEIKQKIIEQIQALKKLTIDNSTQTQNVSRLEQLVNRGLALAQNTVELNASTLSSSKAQQNNQLNNLLDQINEQVQRIEDEEQNELNKLILKSSSSREAVRQALYLGVILNIILALLMASYYSRVITARLALIFENSKLLAKNKPLLPLQTGRDEIARLDRVFHKMAENLAEMSRKEKAVIDNAIDVIFTIDSDGRFSMVNNACLAAWGHAPAELIGQKITKVLHKADKALAMALINKLMKGASNRAFETRLVCKDGSVIDILWSATWSKIEKSLFCVAHDITQRKEVERLKRDFYAMISHDLRTPLTSIVFSLNIVLKRIENLTSQLAGRAAAETSKELTDELQAAEHNCAQLLKLIDSMLTVEKIEAGEITLTPKMFKLSALMKKAEEGVNAYARQQQITLTWQFEDAVIAADEDRLLQVLINLLGNAVKFSPANSEVKLVASLSDNQLSCQVEDHGPGIAKQYLSTIFDRYKQVKTPETSGKGGSGLGLSICRAIVKAHGGEIGVNSVEGKGSTFWFKIPVIALNKLPGKQINKQDSLG